MCDDDRYDRTVQRGIGSASWSECPACGEPMASQGHPPDNDGEVFECRAEACDLDGQVWVRPSGV